MPATVEPATVEPLPIEAVNKLNALPSSAILKENLLPVVTVLSKYCKLRNNIKHVGKLAVILGREAIFGVDVMMQCTPLGGNMKYKGLPINELHFLKKIILQQYPQYWCDLKSFEPVWKKCQVALEHGCSGLRRKKD